MMDALAGPLPRDQQTLLPDLIATADLDAQARARIVDTAADLVRSIRKGGKPGTAEAFLAEYGLSTDEGIALMCLAEAMLRVPDAPTIDALIEDKIAPSDWGKHLGHSASPMVNASTWALMLTGRVLKDEAPGVAGHLRGAIKRLGEPVIRTAVARAMRELGSQFVLGEDIDRAMTRAAKLESQGYTHSYDMLGEAARTAGDVTRYMDAYSGAITAMGRAARGNDIRSNPGISIKLSALHPRYEEAQHDRVMAELVPRVATLARQARDAGIGLNIDAEEADRLSLSAHVIAAVLADDRLAGWDGFGVVVQAYGPRAGAMIDWLAALATRQGRKLMVRLVKGAYWDTEIKRAQVLGCDGFPVFTAKSATDVSYIANARKLLALRDRLYPQFATHNAHTVAAVLEMAAAMGVDATDYEFQRLHGMGERLHDLVMARHNTRCRIYAPVGAHRDLLAYLVRRLLENGANSSFVNQIVDEGTPPEAVAACPFAALSGPLPQLPKGPELFAPTRANARGWDLADARDRAEYEAARAPFRTATFTARPILADGPAPGGDPVAIVNPADPSDTVGSVHPATRSEVDRAVSAARPWDAPASERAATLARAAALYESEAGRLCALFAREAGKTPLDAIGDLREAVDFLHYYGAQASAVTTPPRGVFACISPWNFPLAIFTGQVAAALATGNAVLAKPADQTPLIAHAAVEILHRAGVPRDALQLLPGDGAVGAWLTADARVDGVAFTGSTATARKIQGAMARHLAPGAPLIAETGGLNAMIVDSTALPEQAVRDVLASAFQSAGQRCSALRCLYVQQDVFENFRAMLFGAMDELRLGDPWDIATDVGPAIDASAAEALRAYIDAARARGAVLKELPAPTQGHFVPPTVISVPGIAALEREVFGPVLHIATFRARDLPRVLEEINATGYGLTFGLHSRIDDRVHQVAAALRVGNLYVNRNQIGAVVGSQPFGGEGLSGTGPKAGGPHYLARFTTAPAARADDAWPSPATTARLQAALTAAAPANTPVEVRDMPGPTGESNRLSTVARPPLLCLGPGAACAARQAAAVRALGGVAVEADGTLPPEALATLSGLSGALWWGCADTARAFSMALADRDGPLLPLITGQPDAAHALYERHLCIDTTAAGGNAALLAEVAG
ncbi:bifunctional proline dehydrogenase/L-glutamate gamma-semialdehyde dehydrogenase [Rhodobaculum claviforme]|uniref:Bifunctional protein PutA n=2 Tax=Rhodobaculum claviforme TaxID=1549854 RepID=A0A934TLM8_9RHOB|nr:bifunctional proline dehydrogenase/L-glutamate gamma-semialdehyde dehydrogenase [Rhodobaculum claviforme]